MKATVSTPESWKRIINVEVTVEETEKAYTEKLKKLRKDITLPGFRAGKVPATIINQRYKPAIKAEVIEELVQKSYEDACKEHGITPISQAKINDLKAEDDKPVSFSIETEVDPVIEIKGYDKLRIKPDIQKIKPPQVDEVFDDLRQRMATYTDLSREAKKGDYIKLEYQKVVIDGQERKDVSSPTYPVELGSNKIKEFDKALIGAKEGEILDVSIKFPKDYGDHEIAGKNGQFSIKVTKVQEQVLPEINEEFLKQMGDFKTEDDLRDRIRKDLEGRELDRAKNEAYGKVIDELIKKNPFEVPPSRITAYIDYVLEDMKKYAKEGDPVPVRDEVEQRYRDTGVGTLKRYRIIDFIATAEKIKATSSEVDREIEIMATQYHQQFEELKKRLREDGTTNRIRENIKERKTLDYLIGEYTPGSEAVPAVETK